MAGTDHDPEFYEDDDETADSVWARFRQADKVKTERPRDPDRMAASIVDEATSEAPGGAIRVPTGDLQVTFEGVRLKAGVVLVETPSDVTISR